MDGEESDKALVDLILSLPITCAFYMESAAALRLWSKASLFEGGNKECEC